MTLSHICRTVVLRPQSNRQFVEQLKQLFAAQTTSGSVFITQKRCK